MPKATTDNTPPIPPLTSGKAALAMLEIKNRLAQFASLPANHPDHGIVAICQVHPRNIEAFRASHEDGDADNPLWVEYERTRDALYDSKPASFVGIVAKALAAKAEGIQPDGSDHPANRPAEDWAWELVNDVIRLGTAVNADAELIQLCSEFTALQPESDAAFRIAIDAGTSLQDCRAGLEHFHVKMRPMIKRMVELRAQTPDGLEARLTTATHWLGEIEDHVIAPPGIDLENHIEWATLLLSTFCRDAIGHEPKPVRRGDAS